MSVTINDSYNSSYYYFKNFLSVEDFKEKGGAAVLKELNKLNSNRNGSNEFTNNWTGNSIDQSFVGTTRAVADKGDFIEYIDRNILETTIDNFDILMDNVDMGGAFEKNRIIFTEDKKGIFDFGLASKGLYRLQEFYSEKLKNEKPFEFPKELPGIVPSLNVIKNEFGAFWYTAYDGEKYECIKQQKGQRSIDVKEIGAKLKFSTTTKKSYIIFEKKGGKAKYVDLYVGIGGLQSLNYEGMLARIMPLLLVAKYLESVGIKTKINASRMYRDNGKFYFVNIPIKDYGQDLDFNWIAINVADPRWFRWNLWKFISALSIEDPGLAPTIGYGNTIYGGKEMDEVFGRYKNWLFEKIEKGEEPALAVNKDLMISGGLEHPRNNLSSQQDEIKQEFYRILDVVDFQFNKPNKACERIRKRMIEQYPSTTGTEVKNYIYNTLSRAYSYSNSGQYATPSSEIDKINTKLEEQFEGVVNYLQSLEIKP